MKSISTTFGLALALLLGACGSDSDDALLELTATIDGVSITESTASNPLPLDPTEETVLKMVVTNNSGSTVAVQRVRLEGELLGLNFLTYDVRTRFSVAPSETREVDVPLDFFELERQASGYLRAHVRVYDDNGDRVGGRPFALDIKGDTTSMMGLFSFGLLLITALSAGLNVRDMRRGQLPEQRLGRGIRFAVPGLGVGLLLSVAFSVLRIFPLPATGWIPLTVIPTIAGFVIGYLVVPGPEGDDDGAEGLSDDDLVEALDDEGQARTINLDNIHPDDVEVPAS